MRKKAVMMMVMMGSGWVMANTAPAPVIESCAMRPGTTLMEVTYRVNDPDDATVSAFPLAFVDGVRSFAKVMRPMTFVEGTGANLGTNVAANVSHQLVWDVGADWNVELGNIKFEIICKDSRGLLPLEWLAIPATATTEALTISKNAPTDTEVLNALFFQYAKQDAGLSVNTNGLVKGSAASGAFSGVELVNGTLLKTYAAPYIMKRMNLQPADRADVNLAVAARSGILNATAWHALNKGYGDLTVIKSWGWNVELQQNIPQGLATVLSVACGAGHCIALNRDGTITMWGSDVFGQLNMPTNMPPVITVAAAAAHSLAVKSDGAVLAWGLAGTDGRCNVPAGATNGVALGLGVDAGHNLVVKRDGTVIAWGYNEYAQCNPPAGLSNVIAVAAGLLHSLALKSNGTVVAWGYNGHNQCSVPSGLTNVIAIAAGKEQSIALKSNGTVVAWGYNNLGQCNVPAGLTNVVAIAAGTEHGVALKSDGTVVTWGSNGYGQSIVPAGLSNVKMIAAGCYHSLSVSSEPSAD